MGWHRNPQRNLGDGVVCDDDRQGEHMAPNNNLQFFLRSSLTLGSIFGGASLMHAILRPDLVRAISLFLTHNLSTDEKSARPAQTVPIASAPVEAAPIEGFVATPAFSGSREGFVFKAGPSGLGYYPDVKS